jgi:hypothetical protein
MLLGILAADPLDAFNGSEELGMYYKYKYATAITRTIYIIVVLL